jgi:hypothetical protein
MQSAELRRYLMAGLALASLGLASCATKLSRNECQSMDWRTVGYEDGAAGYPGSQIGTHRKACGEHGVAPDFDAYQAGRAEGLREFCTAANGYRIGAAGGQYAGACPVEREENFLRAFSEGHELYVLRSRVDSAGHQLGAKRRELERLETGVTENAVVAVDPATTKEARVAAVADTAKLAERIGRVKTEIRSHEQDLARLERELDDYLATHSPVVTSR